MNLYINFRPRLETPGCPTWEVEMVQSCLPRLVFYDSFPLLARAKLMPMLVFYDSFHSSMVPTLAFYYSFHSSIVPTLAIYDSFHSSIVPTLAIYDSSHSSIAPTLAIGLFFGFSGKLWRSGLSGRSQLWFPLFNSDKACKMR